MDSVMNIDTATNHYAAKKEAKKIVWEHMDTFNKKMNIIMGEEKTSESFAEYRKLSGTINNNIDMDIIWVESKYSVIIDTNKLIQEYHDTH